VLAAFAEEHGVESPVVELELVDGARFVLSKIEPEPGYGMVTVSVRADDGDDDAPDALIIPLGSIRRLEVRKAPEARVASFGFNLPAA